MDYNAARRAISNAPVLASMQAVNLRGWCCSMRTSSPEEKGRVRAALSSVVATHKTVDVVGMKVVATSLRP